MELLLTAGVTVALVAVCILIESMKTKPDITYSQRVADNFMVYMTLVGPKNGYTGFSERNNKPAIPT